MAVANESDDERVHKLESVNYELRMALKECREQLERLEDLLARSEQDNDPHKALEEKEGGPRTVALTGTAFALGTVGYFPKGCWPFSQ